MPTLTTDTLRLKAVGHDPTLIHIIFPFHHGWLMAYANLVVAGEMAANELPVTAH